MILGGDVNLVVLRTRDLGDTWFQVLRWIIDHGYNYLIDKGSFEKTTQRKELDFITLVIQNPGIRPLSPDVPEGVPVPCTDEGIDNYLSYLFTSDRKEDEEYTYGMYLESQIEKVIQTYKQFGENNNQMCMTIGDMYSISMKDPPCLRLIDTRLRNGKLHFVVYFRSWDAWGGLPTNLGGVQLLKEYMAKEIGVEDGSIVACSKGLHLYDHQWEFAKQVLRDK